MVIRKNKSKVPMDIIDVCHHFKKQVGHHHERFQTPHCGDPESFFGHPTLYSAKAGSFLLLWKVGNPHCWTCGTAGHLSKTRSKNKSVP